MQHENNDEFDVLIIADNPAIEVLPTTLNKSWAFQKLSGFTLLDFCLEWVSWFDSPNVAVVSSTISQESCDAVQKRWASEFKNPNSIKNVSTLKVLHFKNCATVNDLLREVESRRLLTGDFILIDNVATFCSSNLSNHLLAFKSRLRQNNNNVLTMLYIKNESRECPVVGVQNYSNKLMLYQSVHDNSVKVSKNFFVSETIVCSDIAPCGIALCAHEFSSHFSGNYDFQNFDRIIYDILSNEEFLGQNITIEVVSDVVAFSANDYASLLRAQNLIVKRKCFPLTFDNILPHFKDFDRPYLHSNQNVCISLGKECPIGEVRNAVFGKGFLVHETANVEVATFGTNCKIGKGAKIRNCICGDAVKIGENSSVEDCILESNIIIESNCRVSRHSYISSNVTIPSGTNVKNGSVLSSAPPSEKLQKCLDETEDGAWTAASDKVNGYYSWYLKKEGKGGRHLSFWYLRNLETSNQRKRHDSTKSCSSTVSRHSSNRSQLSEIGTDDVALEDEIGVDEMNRTTGAYQGNNERFFEEVLETMSALLLGEDGESAVDATNHADAGQIEKIKLEINASRLTNNVSIEDSTKNIFLAFLSSPGVADSFAKLCKLFIDWDSLWKNYYKRDVSKLQMLHAIEEFAVVEEKFGKIVPNLIYFLFDTVDFLSEDAILKWYNGLPFDSPLNSVVKLKDVIDWIQQSDDEDSEDKD